MPFSNIQIKVLIVDDDEDDFFITSDHMKQITDLNLKIDWCYNYKTALEHVKSRTHDIYFVDYRLGARTGIDLLKEAMQMEVTEPIVLLTGKGNKAIDVEAMKIGATDYLVKTDLNPEKLERCIRYALDRTSTLKALRANERKYRSIFQQSKDAIFTASTTLAFKEVNTTTEDLIGYSQEELSHKTLYDLIPDEADKKLVQKMIYEENDIDNLEIDINASNNERKTCMLSASFETDDQGQEYIQGILHDITELKKAEKANLQMEKLAATGRLVRTLAHEVRNPLNNINMSVEQLVHEKGDTNDLYLDIIKRNSYRIGDLITELLNSSRPSELKFERYPLQSIMDETITEALDRITLQRINMQIRYCDAPAWIHADKDKLKIAFLNIVINAVEAMEQKRGILSISVDQDQNQQRLTISDTGIGIQEENLSRLFEPYFTSKRNGMGLGLASTLNILQSHKATIDVSSVVNKGTTFSINFPSAALQTA